MSNLADLDLVHTLRDGTTVSVRPPRDGDEGRVRDMWSRLSPETVRYRFGGAIKELQDRWMDILLGPQDARPQVTRVATTGRGSGERIVGLAHLVPEDDRTAEFAALVEDDMQGRGIGTILLRELAAIARERGIQRIVGDVLADNVRMLQVLGDLGLTAEHRLVSPMVHTTFDVQPTDTYLAAVAVEEKEAARHALERFLRPRTVAVVGASRTSTSIGGLVFRNLLHGEFTGALYPVNPNARSVSSVTAHPSLRDCPTVPDLVIVCVPAPLVADVVDEAGELGVHAVCVVSAGFAESDTEGQQLQDDLMARVRGHGLRLVGPNCMGLLNGATDVRMNGTFSRVFPVTGGLSFLSQSGALGLSVLARFHELGLGVSTFVSVGNKADISGNDLLLYWEDDPETDVIALYLESFGNPRRFARIARRVGRTKPIVVVKAGRSSSGQRAASSHTAALAAGDVAVDALFQQAGVIRTDSLEGLLGVSRLLVSQPLPRGRRVAVLTNGGGPGILAADAAEANGLELPALSDALCEQLAQLLPPGAGTSNPIDMIASCTAEQYRQATELVAASGEIDALLVIFIPPILTRAEDVAQALAAARTSIEPDLPIVGVFMGHGQHLPELAAARIPTFEYPEDATLALGRAAAYAEWRARPQGSVIQPAHVDLDAARDLVTKILQAEPEGAWLSATDTEQLLTAYGICLARMRIVTSPKEAARAQAELDVPVAVKTAAAIHKRDVDALRLGVATPEEAAAAVEEIDAALSSAGRGDLVGTYIVQEMIDDGVEMAVGVTHDPLFGPLMMVGLGGTLVELLRDVSVRITPLTDLDVDEMLQSLRGYPLLTGYRGSDPVDVDGLRDLLFRLNALVEGVPELAELDLNPVFVRASDVVAVDARIRIAPAPRRPSLGRSR